MPRVLRPLPHTTPRIMGRCCGSRRAESRNGQCRHPEVRKADEWGLRARDFALPQLPAGTNSAEAAAAAEIELTLAVLKYARYARGGRISDPSSISKLLDYTPPVRPPKDVLTDIAASDAPDAYLRSLHPQHEQFEGLRRLLLKLRGRGDEETATAARDRPLCLNSSKTSGWTRLQARQWARKCRKDRPIGSHPRQHGASGAGSGGSRQVLRLGQRAGVSDTSR